MANKENNEEVFRKVVLNGEKPIYRNIDSNYLKYWIFDIEIFTYLIKNSFSRGKIYEKRIYLCNYFSFIVVNNSNSYKTITREFREYANSIV